MEKQITENLMCIVIRGGLEIWLEEKKIKNLQKILSQGRESKFIELDEETINTADITGIFTAQTMKEFAHRKSGEWKCGYGHYHKRGEHCAHGELEKYKRY